MKWVAHGIGAALLCGSLGCGASEIAQRAAIDGEDDRPESSERRFERLAKQRCDELEEDASRSVERGDFATARQACDAMASGECQRAQIVRDEVEQAEQKAGD